MTTTTMPQLRAAPEELEPDGLYLLATRAPGVPEAEYALCVPCPWPQDPGTMPGEDARVKIVRCLGTSIGFTYNGRMHFPSDQLAVHRADLYEATGEVQEWAERVAKRMKIAKAIGDELRDYLRCEGFTSGEITHLQLTSEQAEDLADRLDLDVEVAL